MFQRMEQLKLLYDSYCQEHKLCLDSKDAKHMTGFAVLFEKQKRHDFDEINDFAAVFNELKRQEFDDPTVMQMFWEEGGIFSMFKMKNSVNGCAHNILHFFSRECLNRLYAHIDFHSKKRTEQGKLYTSAKTAYLNDKNAFTFWKAHLSVCFEGTCLCEWVEEILRDQQIANTFVSRSFKGGKGLQDSDVKWEFIIKPKSQEKKENGVQEQKVEQKTERVHNNNNIY